MAMLLIDVTYSHIPCKIEYGAARQWLQRWSGAAKLQRRREQQSSQQRLHGVCSSADARRLYIRSSSHSSRTTNTDFNLHSLPELFTFDGLPHIFHLV